MRLWSNRARILDCREQIAAMLCDFHPATEHRWQDQAEALALVDESVGDDRDRISIVATDGDSGPAIGWVAGLRTYEHAFELHPLVVGRGWQGRGVGRRLLEAFEQAAEARGALTVYLGADDTAARTSLGGLALFGEVLRHAGAVVDQGGHPIGFYRKCGYEVVGVLPDANGLGKPDIWLAKPLGRGGGRGRPGT